MILCPRQATRRPLNPSHTSLAVFERCWRTPCGFGSPGGQLVVVVFSSPSHVWDYGSESKRDFEKSHGGEALLVAQDMKCRSNLPFVKEIKYNISPSVCISAIVEPVKLHQRKQCPCYPGVIVYCRSVTFIFIDTASRPLILSACAGDHPSFQMKVPGRLLLSVVVENP